MRTWPDGRRARDWPYLGAGVGLRREHHDELPGTTRRLDWLEVTPENHLAGGWATRALERCAARWPIAVHGVSLDLGGSDDLDLAYLAHLKALCDRVDAPHFSDHLVWSRLEGTYLHDLLPLPFREDVAAHVAGRIEEARERVGRPFLLENPSWYALMPGSELDEAAFLTSVLERADCGLLLDVNNVVVNAANHGYDARAFVDALPLERVAYVHLAGHQVRDDGVRIDTHGAPVPDPVWDLFEHLLARTGPVSTLLERDQDVPTLDVLLDECDRARAALARAARARQPSLAGAGGAR